jgi:hypothetical protein
MENKGWGGRRTNGPWIRDLWGTFRWGSPGTVLSDAGVWGRVSHVFLGRLSPEIALAQSGITIGPVGGSLFCYCKLRRLQLFLPVV